MIKCPYCKRPFLCGAVTIKGERYYCSYCMLWFKEEDGKFIKDEYIKVKHN